jgi:hypothetical protein
MHMSRSILALAGLTLALAACEKAPDAAPTSSAPPPAEAKDAPPAAEGAGQPQAAQAEGIKPLTQKKFGQPVTETKTTALPELMKEPAKFADQTVRTEGVVSSVCKSMGCWMEIADNDGKAHIKMAGHGFFVPRDCSGHRAVIQGKVLTPEADKGTCGADDGCGQGGSAKLAQVQIEATGIEFVD